MTPQPTGRRYCHYHCRRHQMEAHFLAAVGHPVGVSQVALTSRVDRSTHYPAAARWPVMRHHLVAHRYRTEAHYLDVGHCRVDSYRPASRCSLESHCRVETRCPAVPRYPAIRHLVESHYPPEVRYQLAGHCPAEIRYPVVGCCRVASAEQPHSLAEAALLPAAVLQSMGPPPVAVVVVPLARRTHRLCHLRRCRPDPD